MSAGLLRGTVLRVLSDGSMDGVTRLLTSSVMDNKNEKFQDTLIVVAVPGRHEATSGDGILIRTEGVFSHPANATYRYAEAAPEPSVETRLAKLLSARTLSVQVSKTSSVPGVSLNLGGKVLRRPGTTQDPILQRAFALLKHRSMGDAADNVLILQPSALPAPRSRWQALRGSVSMLARHINCGQRAWFPHGIAETSSMEALGRVWDEAPPSLRQMIVYMSANTRKFAQLSPSSNKRTFNTFRSSLSVVVPYDPVTPPHVFWHALSMMQQGYAPKIQMKSAAIDEITALHEVAHTVQRNFVSTIPKATLNHRGECFADASALLAWLQGGGDPVQARLWADARHLAIFGGTADYLTGPCCDAAIAEGMALRATVVRGGLPLPSASLFTLAASIPTLNAPDEIKEVIKVAMKAQGGLGNTLLNISKIIMECANPEARNCLTRVARVLTTIWTARDISAGAATKVALAETNSLRAHISQLHMRSMGHLATRSVEVSKAHAARAVHFMRKSTEAAAAEWVGVRISKFPGVTRLFSLSQRMRSFEALAVHKLSSARSAMRPLSHPRSLSPVLPVQPYVMLRRSELAVTRGMYTDAQSLYRLHPEERLNKLRLAMTDMKKSIETNDYAGFSHGIQAGIAAGISLVSDLPALRASSHYMPSTQGVSGTALLVQLVEDMQREPSTPDNVENSWEEWLYWVEHGPLDETHKALSSTLLDPVMCKVARHGMWTEGIADGERLDAEDMVFGCRDLRERNMGDCRLVRPDFSGSFLERASLCRATVLSPNFLGAACLGLDIVGTGLSKQDFRGVTSLPAGAEDSDVLMSAPTLIRQAGRYPSRP